VALVAALLLGASAVASAAVLGTGSAASALAASCDTDEFNGTTLDDARWDVLRPVPAGLTVAGGKLNIEMSNTDLISGTATAQNLVLQDAPASGWVATTQLNIASIDANGEQAGLALWKSEGPPGANNSFGKITFIQTNNGTRQFEAIWTDGGGSAVPIASSGTPLPAGVPANADLQIRMRYDGVTVTAEFSTDSGANWTQIGRTARYSGPLRVGLLALRGSAGGGTVAFERFELGCGPEVAAAASTARGTAPLSVSFDGTAAAGSQSPSWDFGDGTTAIDAEDPQHTYTEPGTYRATFSAMANGITSRVQRTVTVLASEPPCPASNDEFSGNALDPKWQLLRPRLTGLDVSGGQLRLAPYGGDMHGGTASVRNVLLQPAPVGVWKATTKFDTSNTGTNDQAGILMWRGEAPNNFAKIVFNRRSATQFWVERQNNINGVTQAGGGNAGTITGIPANVFIRVSSDGAANPNISAEYSTDGTTWTAVVTPFPVGGTGQLKVGIASWGPEGLRTGGFDFFHVEGATACGDPDTTAPATTLTASPAAPAGGTWFTSPPQITLSAVDDAAGSGVQKTEYRVDGGSFQTYTTPFSFPAGDHTVQYRSIDGAGNAEAEQSFSAKVDPNAPTTTAALDPAQPGPGGTYDGPVQVSLNATDGADGSGVDATQYRVDGGPWQNYTDPAEEVIFDGTQASLDNWAQAGAGSFNLLPNGAIQGQGGLGMLWYPVKQYGNFSLKFQFRDARTDADFANGGAFVRFPDPRVPLAERTDNCSKTGSAQTDQAWVAIYCGHEIQAYDGPSGEVQKTGSIYNFQPLNLTQAKPVPKGDWSDYEIRVVGQQYTIIRNGEVINRFDNSIPKASSRGGDPPTQDRQFAQGYIGLQNHSNADLLQYRNIRVSELSGAQAGAFTISDNGSHTVDYRSRDVAGNLEATKSVAFSIGEPEPVNIFDTIGITESANRGNSQIFGNPQKYSLPAEEMPASRSIVTPPNDALDDVKLRMPNTTGTVPNLAAFKGQTVILRDPLETKKYSKVHFFGTTTDGGPAGGDFVLTYSDTSTQSATVRFKDWCDTGDPTPEIHVAIGPLSKRYTETGQDGAPCGIYHVPIAVDPSKTLVSVKLPSTTTPGNAPIQAYLMALTLEEPDGAFVMPDLGASAFPDDLTAPTSTHTLDPPQPQGQNGWYRTPVQITLAAADEQGGSGLDEIEYRVDGGAFQPYTAPVTVTPEGAHVVQYRASDKAGNTEAPKSVDVKIDATAPTTTAQLDPRQPGASGWYDDAVQLTLRSSDGAGSGGGTTEYRIGTGDWQTYNGPVVLSDVGTYSISYRTRDAAGNLEQPGGPVVAKVDGRAPTTRAALDPAQPGAGGTYRGPVSVSLAADDGAGSGVEPTATEYRVDGGAFQRYAGPFALSALGGHLVEFRSTDRAGNLENLKELTLLIVQPQPSGGDPPFVGLVPRGSNRMGLASLVRNGLKVSATCVSVGRGTLKLAVTRAVARKLGLKGTTLAQKSVRCGSEFKLTARLKPGGKVAKALKRARGSYAATLSLTMSGAGGRATDSQRLVLRGKRPRG
jgi:PKD repeat protein